MRVALDGVGEPLIAIEKVRPTVTGEAFVGAPSDRLLPLGSSVIPVFAL
jgi:hypothetical protein